MKTIQSQFDEDAGDYEEVLPENEDEAMAYVMGKMNKGRQEKAGMKHIEKAALNRIETAGKDYNLNKLAPITLSQGLLKARLKLGALAELIKQEKAKIPKAKDLLKKITVKQDKERVERYLKQYDLNIERIEAFKEESKKPKAVKPRAKPSPFDMPSDDEMRSGSYKTMMGSYDAKIRKKALEWRFGKDVVRRVTSGKHGGDDMYSYAVFIDGRPFVTGESQYNVAHYKMQAYKKLAGKADKLMEGK